jgi:hypothetical protein
MSCQACVEANAAHIARFAPHLPTAAVQQLFHALYSAEPCLHMVAAFVSRATAAGMNCGSPLTDAPECASPASSPGLRRKPPVSTPASVVGVSAVA